MANQIFHIEISGIRWVSDKNIEQDYCSHSDIQLSFNGVAIQDPSEEPDPWCISTAALHLLRSAHEDLIYTDEDHQSDQHLIPHCGHCILGGTPPVFAYGTCPIGINWSVQHNTDSLRLFDVKASWETSGEIYRYPIDLQMAWDEYASPICNLALEVKAFHKSSLPKIYNDNSIEQGMKSFWKEYNTLLDQCVQKLGL